MKRREFIAELGSAALLSQICPLFSSKAHAQKTGSNQEELEKQWTRKALHWAPLDNERIECALCPRYCKIADKERGYCGVRENQKGIYNTLVYGRICSAHIDPIEKKPLFHYKPGSKVFSIAAAGCNMECNFCQNWQISQFRPEQIESYNLQPADLIEAVIKEKCDIIAYTYTEPVVYYEYMYDCAKLGKIKGIASVMISNGYINEKPLRELCEQLSAVKIDFKAFTDRFYKEVCSGELQPILNTLKILKSIGIWFELVVLVIPTLNDSPEEFSNMCKWILDNLGPDVPMHFSRFHPMYKIKDLPSTPIKTLEKAKEIAAKTGLHYVYIGNVSPHEAENTYCPICKSILIKRIGYTILSNKLSGKNKCPDCQTEIPGIW